ncbi:hypothetical protein MKX03_015202, partial [Papaver bracteatum]
ENGGFKRWVLKALDARWFELCIYTFSIGELLSTPNSAVDNFNSIIGHALIGKDPTQQTKIDIFMVRELDRTTNEWDLEPMVSLAVSLVVCKAGASVLDIPFTRRITFENKLAMQEFMILPVGAKSFKEAMKMGSVIKKKYSQDATNVGDEGGFSPNIQEKNEGLELLKTAIDKAGSDKTYDLNFKEDNNNGAAKISSEKSKDLYKSFSAEYPRID